MGLVSNLLVISLVLLGFSLAHEAEDRDGYQDYDHYDDYHEGHYREYHDDHYDKYHYDLACTQGPGESSHYKNKLFTEDKFLSSLGAAPPFEGWKELPHYSYK